MRAKTAAVLLVPMLAAITVVFAPAPQAASAAAARSVLCAAPPVPVGDYLGLYRLTGRHGTKAVSALVESFSAIVGRTNAPRPAGWVYRDQYARSWMQLAHGAPDTLYAALGVARGVDSTRPSDVVFRPSGRRIPRAYRLISCASPPEHAR